LLQPLGTLCLPGNPSWPGLCCRPAARLLARLGFRLRRLALAAAVASAGQERLEQFETSTAAMAGS